MQYKIDNRTKITRERIPLAEPRTGGIKIRLIDKMGREIKEPGKVGEIVASSDYYISRYWKSVESEKKLTENSSGGTYFETGDLGKIVEPGLVEYVGREDFLVKVNGYRISTEEIEKNLIKLEGIENCLVVAKEDILTAYYTAKVKINPLDLGAYLKNRLPDYMIPSFFIQLDKFPLNPSGMIDRLALPELSGDQSADPIKYRLPTTELEKKLVKIWQEVLGIKKIGINDNFFDLGGNSLKIVKANSKLKELLDINLPPVMMFKYSTIKSLASHLINDGKLIDENTYNKYHTKSLKNNNLLSRSVRLLRKNSISL